MFRMILLVTFSDIFFKKKKKPKKTKISKNQKRVSNKASATAPISYFTP
jgi:hypothetical protein